MKCMATGTVFATLVLSLLLAGPRLTSSAQAAEAGRVAFERHCAICHGIEAKGTDKGPTFIHRVYHPGHHGDAAFLLAPRRGARQHHWEFGDMKPVPDVTDDELAEIVRYVRELQKASGLF